MQFLNRQQAGRELAEKLEVYGNLNPFVLALPRGGVPVAYEIARRLNAPLDVLVVRKIGHPLHEEFAVGALCEDGEPYWDEKTLARSGLEPDDLGPTVRNESQRIRRQTETFRNGQSLPSLIGRIAIVVDDGLATGATMSAAIRFLKKRGVVRIVVAVPIAAASSVRRLESKVEAVIALEKPEDLRSVGEWYRDFSQVSDDEVVNILQASREIDLNKKDVLNLEIPVGQIKLAADFTTFSSMSALIIFVHGSGSSRRSPRNKMVAEELNRAGFGTLLFDLLTDEEAKDRKNIFDIDMLSERLLSVTRWVRQQSEIRNDIKIGYFGASTGAAAAIKAASGLREEEHVFAIVSRGGRPDLAGAALRLVDAPTLLLIGSLDFEVIELNRNAQSFLVNSELSIVSGATHLFEESGTLEQVSRSAVEWFRKHLQSISMKSKSQQLMTLDEEIESKFVPVRDDKDFDRLIEAVKDTRIVMLGESSHGTEEFYKLRSLISKRLIEDHGFNFIAVEGDWPDAYRLNRYIRTGEGETAKSVLKNNNRWPTWMWANNEIVELAEWMRNRSASFYGLDVYSLFESIEEVVSYLKKVDPALADEVERRYACFDPFEGDEVSYARSLIKYPPGCENEVLLNLQKLIELRVQMVSKDGEELFNSQENAHVVADAEAYYRSMLGGDATSWNVRDGHMMETLDRLLARHGEGSKAIVWAHNTHIGDYRATDMKEAGYVNIGGLARQAYGDDNVALIGFGTYQGTVLAGSGWNRSEEIMNLPEAKMESYEYHFHKVAKKHDLNEFYVFLDGSVHSPFSRRLGHRAVGVVYDPKHEQRGNYVPTELSKRYDAFVFVDQTRALKSLKTAFQTGKFSETWPSGQ